MMIFLFDLVSNIIDIMGFSSICRKFKIVANIFMRINFMVFYCRAICCDMFLLKGDVLIIF